MPDTTNKKSESHRGADDSDDVLATNWLALDAAKQGEREESQGNPVTLVGSSHIGSRSEVHLLQASRDDFEEQVCRPVRSDYLHHYLALALQMKWNMEDRSEKFCSAKLGEELARKQDLPGGTATESQVNNEPHESAEATGAFIRKKVVIPEESPMVEASKIQELLSKFDIKVEYWQSVTETADIVDLLRAEKDIQDNRARLAQRVQEKRILSEKALEAERLGLPLDATPRQREVRRNEKQAEEAMRQQLLKLDLVKTISYELRNIRENPGQHTKRLKPDGTVELKSLKLSLPSWQIDNYFKFKNDIRISSGLGGAALGALPGVGLILFESSIVADRSPGVFLAMVGGACGMVLGVNLAERILKVLFKKCRPKLTSASLQAALQELEDVGIKYDTRLSPDEEQRVCLKLDFYLPPKPEQDPGIFTKWLGKWFS
jgi:hypothetical protein